MNRRNWLAAGGAALCLAAPALAPAQGVYTVPGLNGPNPVPAQPYAQVNPNNGTPCYVGNTGCPTVGGGGSGGGNAAAGATGGAAPSSADYTGYFDGTIFRGVDPTHGLPTVVLGSVAVTGTFWQATQPVSLTSLPAYASTPTFNCGTGCYQTTQPVSGSVSVSNQPTTIQPIGAATGGSGVLCNLSLKATATACKASAGAAYNIQINNSQNTVEEDVAIYALAVGSVTVGTTTVTKCIGVGPGMVAVIPEPVGLSFANAITVAVTTGVGSACTGTTAPTNFVGVSIDGQ